MIVATASLAWGNLFSWSKDLVDAEVQPRSLLDEFCGPI